MLTLQCILIQCVVQNILYASVTGATFTMGLVVQLILN